MSLWPTVGSHEALYACSSLSIGRIGEAKVTIGRPFPETWAIARARANPAQNRFARAFFRPCSFSNQCSHLIMQLSFPIFEILTLKYQGACK